MTMMTRSQRFNSHNQSSLQEVGRIPRQRKAGATYPKDTQWDCSSRHPPVLGQPEPVPESPSQLRELKELQQLLEIREGTAPNRGRPVSGKSS